MRWPLYITLVFVVAVPSSPVLSQIGPGGAELTVEHVASTLADSMLKAAAFTRLFRDPASIKTLNKIWKDNVIPDSRLLKDLNIEFKTYKVNEVDTVFGLGASYSYSKDLTRRRLHPGSQSGISLSATANGNVAFEARTNPSDFLDSELSFHLYRSWGGTIRSTNEVRDQLNHLETSLATIDNPEKLVHSAELAEFLNLSKQHLRDQFYLDVSLDGGIESDQAFDSMQYTYGATLGADVKLWGSEYFNVFDWPFAAIRWLSGCDPELSPIGGTFPTIQLAIERVHPQDDPSREVLGETSDYTRFHAEAAFRTPVSSTSFFETNLRFYKELSPPSTIKDANLDEYAYLTTSLATSQGIFVSYTSGKLPFDAKDDQVYQLGFRYQF